MDILALLLAFIFGLGARSIGLPPLVGFLLTGFVLKQVGVVSGGVLAQSASVGVTLLLFTIGLKLKVRGLARPEVWAGASIHATVTVIVLGAAIWLFSTWSFPHFAHKILGKVALLAITLSITNTEIASKVQEQNG